MLDINSRQKEQYSNKANVKQKERHTPLYIYFKLEKKHI